jgi:hypothetical protein
MGSLWKELAARWLGGETTLESPSMTSAETGKPKPAGDMIRQRRISTRVLSRVTNEPDDQSPEEALQPDTAVRYPY